MIQRVQKLLSNVHWATYLWDYEKLSIVKSIAEFVKGQQRVVLYQLAKQLDLKWEDNSIVLSDRVITIGEDGISVKLLERKRKKVSKPSTDVPKSVRGTRIYKTRAKDKNTAGQEISQ